MLMQAKQTICYVHLGRLQQARSGIDKLKADAVDGLYDLCLDVADALLDTNRPSEVICQLSLGPFHPILAF